MYTDRDILCRQKWGRKVCRQVERALQAVEDRTLIPDQRVRVFGMETGIIKVLHIPRPSKGADGEEYWGAVYITPTSSHTRARHILAENPETTLSRNPRSRLWRNVAYITTPYKPYTDETMEIVLNLVDSFVAYRHFSDDELIEESA